VAEGDFQDKTEKATSKKRSESREEGQVAKSREIPSVAVLLTGLSTLYLSGSFVYSHIETVMKESFSIIERPSLNMGDFLVFNYDIVRHFIIMMAPMMIAIVVVAIASNVVQVGWLFTWKPLMPKFSKLNPIQGIARLFSKESLVELLKSTAKLTLVGLVVYWTVQGEMPRVVSLGEMEISRIAIYILRVILKIFLRVSVAMIFLAALDYIFQKWQFEQKLKMTKQEVKEELKQSEGDPLIKSRIRRVQQEMARRRMMQEVPKADVVVTNPVHLALALRYDSGVMNAPQVVAKGAGALAEKIKALAKEHNIPIVEDRDLARRLYEVVEIGREIPSTFYHAVAEVLTYVYRLKGKVR